MLGGQPWRAGVVAPPSVAALLTWVAAYRQHRWPVCNSDVRLQKLFRQTVPERWQNSGHRTVYVWVVVVADRCSGRDINPWRQLKRHVVQSQLHSVDEYYFHREPACPAQVPYHTRLVARLQVSTYFMFTIIIITVLYQVLNKQVPVPVPVPVVQVPVRVPVPNLQVPVPVQVLCINYRHSVTLQLHKVKVVVFFIFKKSNS